MHGKSSSLIQLEMLFRDIKVNILKEQMLHLTPIMHFSQDKKISWKMFMFIGHESEAFL